MKTPLLLLFLFTFLLKSNVSFSAMELQDIPYSTPKQTLGNCIPIKLMLWRVTSSNNYQAIAEDGFGKKVIFPSTRILEKEEEIPPDGEWYICENMSDFFMYDTLYLLKPKTSV